MVLRKSGLAAAILIASSPAALAGDLQINGFMNVTAGTVSSSDDISIDGYDKDLSFDNGTLIGLQMTNQVNDSTSATVQLISRGAENYNTQASWAYITYSATDNTDVRMGRLRTPMFYYSDFLEVGYAYNWARPPATVYRLDFISSLNGIDVTQRFSMGSVDGMVQLYTGHYEDDFELNGDEYHLQMKKATGVVLSMNYGDFGARFSAHKADISLDVSPADPTVDGTRALDGLAYIAAGTAIAVSDPSVAEAFVADEATSKFYQASLSYDNGSQSAIAEWTSLKHDTALINDDTAYLVSAAQRLGDATLHLTYTATSDDLKSGTIGQVQKHAEVKESVIIAGVRYDYDSSTAFKFDIQQKDQELDDISGILYTVGMSLVF